MICNKTNQGSEGYKTIKQQILRLKSPLAPALPPGATAAAEEVGGCETGAERDTAGAAADCRMILNPSKIG